MLLINGVGGGVGYEGRRAWPSPRMPASAANVSSAAVEDLVLLIFSFSKKDGSQHPLIGLTLSITFSSFLLLKVFTFIPFFI